jgi:hypothetical protein
MTAILIQPGQCPVEQPVLQLTPQKLIRGEAVRSVQQLVNFWQDFWAIGTPLATDGVYGPKTQAAVKSIQCMAFLTVDGIVGPQTWGFLCKGFENLPTLKMGSTGSFVTRLQAALRAEGILPSFGIDGIFGQDTDRSVRFFQQELRQIGLAIAVNGVVNAEIWAQLSRRTTRFRACGVVSNNNE